MLAEHHKVLSYSSVLPVQVSIFGRRGERGGVVPVRYRTNAVSSWWSLGRKLVTTDMHNDVLASCL